MNTNSGSSWERFVQDNLLYANTLDGILLITSYGEQIYCWGPKIDEDECKQFKGVFNSITENQELAICQKGFTLKRDHDNIKGFKVHYKVYKKSLCSMYCMSENRQSGLIVCNLPYGMLITTYSHPVKAQDAIELVENACTLLRN
ncbi:Hypothetical predicted protein [Paramuricea clavata]|uniref:Uncharacterized protein n=1 Tax=Paramuricea clavata TaxID=317549 RepID=A0A7D9J8M9_PARCT|nr:Hypothetical predicted protein [Paramuricea clavata]